MTMSNVPRQRGMSLLAALFLIVVVATLAAFAIRVGSAQRHTAAFALIGDRALAAANSGIEWGAFRALSGSACSGTLTLNQTALRGFRVQVTCAGVNHTEDLPAPTTYQVYDITAFAQWGTFGAADYTTRTVSKRFTNAP